MKILRIVAELTYDNDLMHGDDPEAVAWFRESVLMGTGLILHDNDEIGDHVGELKVLSVDDPKPAAVEQAEAAFARAAEAWLAQDWAAKTPPFPSFRQVEWDRVWHTMEDAFDSLQAARGKAGKA